MTDDPQTPLLATPLPPCLRPQHGESAAAYAAFQLYANLPASNRSIVKAAESAGDNRAAKVRQMEKWSAAFDWVARAREADAAALATVRTALVDQQVAVATVAGEKVLAALRLLDPADLAKRPGYIPRYIEAWGSLSRLLGGLPTQITENRAAEEEQATAYRTLMATLQARAQAVATAQQPADEALPDRPRIEFLDD